RLDKDTSGLMIFAKDEKTKTTLQDYWNEIVTDRLYVAVLSGEKEKDNGTVTSWLKDNKVFITYSSASDNGGDKSITHYKTIKRANGYSLIVVEKREGLLSIGTDSEKWEATQTWSVYRLFVFNCNGRRDLSCGRIEQSFLFAIRRSSSYRGSERH
ncbi:hypothetical protein EZS27_044149, partial [termite gut metagenome]